MPEVKDMSWQRGALLFMLITPLVGAVSWAEIHWRKPLVEKLHEWFGCPADQVDCPGCEETRLWGNPDADVHTCKIGRPVNVQEHS